MNEPVKVAIDLHGTYDTDPELFNKIMFDTRNSNADFVIFSGSPVDDIREQFTALFAKHELSLDKTVVHSMDYLSVVDECRKFGYPMIQKEVKSRSTGEMRLNWYLDGPDELWWPMKSVLCTLHNIDILIDDKSEYGNYFGNGHKTKFIKYERGKYTDKDVWANYVAREILCAEMMRLDIAYRKFM